MRLSETMAWYRPQSLAFWCAVSCSLLAGSPRPAAAQTVPPAASRSSSNALQRLVGDVAFQTSLVLRADPQELNRRRSQLARVIEAWNGSDQTQADRREMELWLRAALRASMPGTLGPLPEPPRFLPDAVQLVETLPAPPTVSAPASASVDAAAPSSLPPAFGEPLGPVVANRPILDSLAGPATPSSLPTPQSEPAAETVGAPAAASGDGDEHSIGHTHTAAIHEPLSPPESPDGPAARGPDTAGEAEAASASFAELFGLTPPAEAAAPESQPSGMDPIGSESAAAAPSETDLMGQDPPGAVTSSTAAPNAESDSSAAGGRDIWSELAAAPQPAEPATTEPQPSEPAATEPQPATAPQPIDRLPTQPPANPPPAAPPKGDPFLDDPPATSPAAVNPAPASPAAVNPAPVSPAAANPAAINPAVPAGGNATGDRPASPASQVPLNLPELRSRVEGDDARLRQIESRLISSPAMSAAELRDLAEGLRELLRQREFVGLYLSSLTDSERASVSELRSAEPVLRLLRQRIADRQQALRQDTASPASTHYRELSLLEDALQTLAPPANSP